MLRAVARCLALLLCSLFAVTLYAQQFSADLVDLRPDRKSNPAKVYVSNDKLRFETQDRTAGGNVAMIWDIGHQTRYLLMADRRMYMDYSPIMGSKLPVTLYWHPSDINNACPEWHKLAEQMKHTEKWGTCRKVGSDTVNGRSTIKYEGSSTDGKTGDVWIDSKLRYVTKYEDKDGGMELRNIQEGSQPANLFEIPAGYQKFDLGNMRLPQR
jgi:hypothetical protein